MAGESTFRCPRCAADPQPSNFGNPRHCAFTATGEFTTENWNCATLDALMELMGLEDEHHGTDESLQLVKVRLCDDTETNGWIVLTRYKHRGCTSSAIHVGDFWPAQPLTYTLAAQILNGTVGQEDNDVAENLGDVRGTESKA